MIESLDEILTRTILSSIPKNVKPLRYLMETLDIGRESVYRRLKGVIPFTFDEIIKLSIKLHFSLDEIVEKNTGNSEYTSDYHSKNHYTPEQQFYTTHLNYYKSLQTVINSEQVDILLSLNRLFSFFVVNFDMLFKFYYYVWLNQYSGNLSNCRFSEIQLPSQVAAIQQQIKEKASSIKNITFIFDRYILLKLIREIQYYYSRQLITDDELQGIKNDITAFLDYIEKCIQVEGSGDAGSTHQFYLSLLSIEMNSVYGILDGNVVSQCWMYANTPQNIGHTDLIASHKNWIHSLKRSSILISHSNEIAQASFLNQQRKNIDSITNDLFLYYG